MTRFVHLARSSLLALTRRSEAEESMRAPYDPLSALWHFLEMPAALAIGLGLAGLLILSGLAIPDPYLHQSNTFGWPTDSWPAASQRLTGLALLGSTPWGQVILGLLLVLAVVRAAASLDTALHPAETSAQAEGRPAAAQRAVIYAEVALERVQSRIRLALTLMGYRVTHDEGSTPSLLASSQRTHAWAQAVAAGALAVLALLGLIAPKVTSAEVLDLEPGQPRWSQAGLLLAASSEPGVAAQSESAASSHRLAPRAPMLLGSTIVVWHGSGPALTVAPVADDPGGYGLLIPFLPGQPVKYITVPETGASVRVSLTPSASGAEFEVQPLTSQGQPAGAPLAVSEATVIPVAQADLALAPADYQIVWALRAPLWWPGAVAVLVCIAALGLTLLSYGPTLGVALSERAGIVTVEVEAYDAPASGGLWLRALRLALR